MQKRFFTLILGIFAAFSLINAQETSKPYALGDVVEPFTLMNWNQTEYSMPESVRGYIIVFTCNHCPYSVLYEDRIIALHQKYAERGYALIAINPNDPNVQPEDSPELMKERAIAKGFKFPYLFDEGQQVFPRFGATRTPHVFILDRERVLRYIGAIDNDPQGELYEAEREALASKKGQTLQTEEAAKPKQENTEQKAASTASTDQEAPKKLIRYVENAIAALEKGANPDPATTKAIGCSIKVAKQ